MNDVWIFPNLVVNQLWLFVCLLLLLEDEPSPLDFLRSKRRHPVGETGNGFVKELLADSFWSLQLLVLISLSSIFDGTIVSHQLLSFKEDLFLSETSILHSPAVLLSGCHGL